MRQYRRDTLAVADPHIVKLFTEHLIAAFEAFIDEYPGTVDYVDGFMAAHNFHKVIVGHLVSETGDAGLWKLALDTFEWTAGGERQMSKDAEHVKVRNTESGEYEMICEHCGLRGIITPPMPMVLFLGMMTKLGKDHKHCKPATEVAVVTAETVAAVAEMEDGQ